MNWLKGLAAAALSGAASTLGAMAIDPDHFNTSNLRHLGLVAALGAITGTVGYLKQSPLPNGAIAPATEAIDPKRFAGMGVLLLCVCLGVSACTKPDLPTLLQDAKYGLDAVCVIGQNTLSPAVCADGDHVLDAARALALKDGDRAVAPIKALLVDLETRQPSIAAWTHWLTSRL